jgi:hypothetical protein
MGSRQPTRSVKVWFVVMTRDSMGCSARFVAARASSRRCPVGAVSTLRSMAGLGRGPGVPVGGRLDGAIRGSRSLQTSIRGRSGLRIGTAGRAGPACSLAAGLQSRTGSGQRPRHTNRAAPFAEPSPYGRASALADTEPLTRRGTTACTAPRARRPPFALRRVSEPCLLRRPRPARNPGFAKPFRTRPFMTVTRVARTCAMRRTQSSAYSRPRDCLRPGPSVGSDVQSRWRGRRA